MLIATVASMLGVAALAIYALRSGRCSSGSLAQALQIASFVAAVLAAILVGPGAFVDADGFAVVAVGVPLILCLLPLLARVAHRAAAITTWACAVCLLAWALLLGLGVGLYFGPAALLLLGAAACQDSGSQRHSGATAAA